LKLQGLELSYLMYNIILRSSTKIWWTTLVVLCKWPHCDLWPFPQVSDPGPFGPSCYILFIYVMNMIICMFTWTFQEGSCILTGLSHNGTDMNGNVLWDGCSNVRLYVLETASTFRQIIAGFNITTNSWMSRCLIIVIISYSILVLCYFKLFIFPNHFMGHIDLAGMPIAQCKKVKVTEPYN